MAPPPWTKALHRLVGERLQRLRKSTAPKPFTQSELADRTREVLSRSSIANIERGLQGVSLAQLYALAQALNVQPGELLPSREEVIQPKSGGVESLSAGLGKDDRAWIQRVQQSGASKRGGDDA